VEPGSTAQGSGVSGRCFEPNSSESISVTGLNSWRRSRPRYAASPRPSLPARTACCFENSICSWSAHARRRDRTRKPPLRLKRLESAAAARLLKSGATRQRLSGGLRNGRTCAPDLVLRRGRRGAFRAKPPGARDVGGGIFAPAAPQRLVSATSDRSEKWRGLETHVSLATRRHRRAAMLKKRSHPSPTTSGNGSPALGRNGRSLGPK